MTRKPKLRPNKDEVQAKSGTLEPSCKLETLMKEQDKKKNSSQPKTTYSKQYFQKSISKTHLRDYATFQTVEDVKKIQTQFWTKLKQLISNTFFRKSLFQTWFKITSSKRAFVKLLQYDFAKHVSKQET